MIAGLMILGLLLDHGWGYPIVFVLMAGCSAASAAVYGLLLRHQIDI
jgi:hypothetical protein